MPYFELTDDKFKLYAVTQLFVAPADYNYIHARFCRIVGLHKEFSWQCLQALEKYFKAGLVLNNVSAKVFSHNLPKLLESHREAYGEFAITDPTRPAKLTEELWKSKTLDELVEWIYHFGHPDSRYGLRSYENQPSDLFLFDEFVFDLRRRIGRLNSIIGTDIYANDEVRDDVLEQCRGEEFSHLINAHPRFQLFKMNVPNVSFADVGCHMEDALYSWNFPWARSDDDLSRPPPGTINTQFGGFGNSVLNMLREGAERANPSPERINSIHRRMEWLFAHVPLGKGVEGELRKVMPLKE